MSCDCDVCDGWIALSRRGCEARLWAAECLLGWGAGEAPTRTPPFPFQRRMLLGASYIEALVALNAPMGIERDDEAMELLSSARRLMGDFERG